MACIYSIPILQTPYTDTCSCQYVCCAHAHQHMHWSQKDVRCPALSLSTLFPQKGSLSECGAKLVAKKAPVILLSQPHTGLGFQASMPQSKQIVFLIYWWICLLCMYVCESTPSAPAHMWRSEDTLRQDFLSYHVGSKGGIQVHRFHGKDLYPLEWSPWPQLSL